MKQHHRKPQQRGDATTANTKLSKNKIEQVKSLHQPKHRHRAKKFLVEGRKLVESISLPPVSATGAPAGGIIYPTAVYLTQEQYKDIERLCSSQQQQFQDDVDHPSAPPPTTPHAPMPTSFSPTSSINDLLGEYKQQHFLKHSKQLNWSLREDGRLVAPPIHSLEQNYEGLSMSMHHQSLYHHILRNGQIVEPALFSRLSQFSTPPGLIAEYDYLTNVKPIQPPPPLVDGGDGDDDDDDGAQINFHTHKQHQHPLLDPFQTNSAFTSSPTTPRAHHNIPNDDAHHDSSMHTTPTTLQYHGPRGATHWDWKRGGLVMSAVSDPGNLGTLIRTAHAFNIKQILLLDCVDVYNNKTISASGGAIATSNIVSTTSELFLTFYQQQAEKDQHLTMAAIAPYGAVTHTQTSPATNTSSTFSLNQPYLVGLTPSRGVPLEDIPHSLQQHIVNQISHTPNALLTTNTAPTTIQNTPPSAHNLPWLVVGSEAFGLPRQIEELLHVTATITMTNADNVGSLNAAVAGSIAAFQFAGVLNPQQKLWRSLQSSSNVSTRWCLFYANKKE